MTELTKEQAAPPTRSKILCYLALAVALLAACSYITLPFAVPFTLQTFGISLILCLLGGRYGSLAVATYLICGCLGAPVFAGFRGGPAVLLGPTGGYLIGFLLLALCYRILIARFGDGLRVKFAALVLGHLLVYAFGATWFYLVYAAESGGMGWGAILSLTVLPYLLPDFVKLLLALSVSRRFPERVRLT